MKRWGFGLLVFVIFLTPLINTRSTVSASEPTVEQAVVAVVQTGGLDSGTTAQELILIYNNTNQPIDVTNWCVTYSSSSDITQTKLGCIAAPGASTNVMLAGYSYFSLSTIEFNNVHTGFMPDATFISRLTGTSGHIRLLNSGDMEIDKLGWSTMPSSIAANPEGTSAAAPATGSGKVLQRIAGLGQELKDTNNNSVDFSLTSLALLPASGLYEEYVITDVCINIDGLQTDMPAGYLLDNGGNCQLDVCADIEGLQLIIPNGYESLDGENCTLIPLEGAALLITELLPNAASFDSGKEFIEIYNPNNRPVNLEGYIFQLGPNYSKNYPLLSSLVIAPGSYLAFSDEQTGIVLSNSSASARLIAPNGSVVSSTGTYNLPEESNSWALINDVWQYTNQLTPGSANLEMLIAQDGETDADGAMALALCAAGKERNPETNRCRTIQTAITSLTACKAGQERNPETNRCRSILANSDGLTPCKEDQERNPETNRCRSTSSNGSELVPCKAGQERNPDTNRCRNSTALSSSLKPCVQGQERNPDTNRCKKAGSGNVAGLAKVKDVDTGSLSNNPRWLMAGFTAVGAVGYGAYEWRREVFGFLSKLKSKLPV